MKKDQEAQLKLGFLLALVCCFVGCAQTVPETKTAEILTETEAPKRSRCGFSIRLCFDAAMRDLNSESQDRQENGLLTFEELCQREDPASCEALGTVQTEHQIVLNDKWIDHEEGSRNLEFACNAGLGMGCNNLGVNYAQGRGVEQDQVKAVEYFRRACSARDGKGCANLGFRYGRGLGVERDLTRELSYSELACELNDANGCHNFANLLDDVETSTKYYGKGCHLGGLLPCVHYVRGLKELGEIDEQTLNAELENLCDLGESEGCRWRGIAAAKTDDEKELGIEFAKRACDLQANTETLACYQLAVMYNGYYGRPAEYEKANELFEKSCTHWLQPKYDACVMWAENVELGNGLPANPARAEEIRQEALKPCGGPC